MDTQPRAARADLNDFYSTASGQSFRSLVMILGAAATTYQLVSPEASQALSSQVLAAGPVIVGFLWGLKQVYSATKVKLAAAAAAPGTPVAEIHATASAMTWREVLLGTVDEGLEVVARVARLEQRAQLLEARADDLVARYLELVEKVAALEKRLAVRAAGAAPLPSTGTEANT